MVSGAAMSDPNRSFPAEPSRAAESGWQPTGAESQRWADPGSSGSADRPVGPAGAVPQPTGSFSEPAATPWQAGPTTGANAPVYYHPGPVHYGPPPPPVALPVEARQYHEFFRTPRNRWWRGLLALVMFVGIWLVLNVVLSGVAIGVDVATGRVDPAELLAAGSDPTALSALIMTPLMFTVNNICLAAAIPLAGLSAWALEGQRPRWMSSIAGGFRWRLFWPFLLVATPVFAAGLLIDFALAGVPEFRFNPDTVFLIVAIVLTTPLQAAGEEYGVRGLLTRVIGSWTSSRAFGLIAAMVISSLVFMSLHLASNLWLNIYYFMVGIGCSILVWRTGGLEAAVALHIANNLVGEVTLPFGGLESAFDRGATVVGPEALWQLAFTFTVVGGMLLLARWRRLPMEAAPGKAESTESSPGSRQMWWDSSQTGR